MNAQVAEMFNRLRAKLTPTLNELPQIIGNAGVNYSLDAFDEQGFEGEAWQERQSNKDAGRAILVKTGRLKRSIRVIRTTATSVVWGSTGVPYAQAQNDGATIERAARSETFTRNRYERGPKSKMFGGMGAFKKGTTPGEGQTYKAHTITIPARPFIRNTPAMRAHLVGVARDEIRKALQS